MNRNILSFVVFIVFSTSFLKGQEILLQENFDACTTPDGWVMSATNNLDAGLTIGYPLNPNSDSLGIDGTCMVMFDDDLLGNNMPTFVGELKSPLVQSSDYQTIRLETDIVFRQYETTTFTVFIEETDGTRTQIRQYGSNDQTGTSFSDFSTMNIDLTFFTDVKEFYIVYQYDDHGIWGWWAGMDNVRVTGTGEGTKIFSQQFDDCTLPTGWSTNVLEGDDDWQFGYIENGNAATNSMNGTRFASFEADGIGQEAAFSTTELVSPVFDGSQFATFEVEFEMIFRQYSDLEYFSVLVYDGTDYYRVQDFVEETAEQFNDYTVANLDLTPFRSQNMQLVFRYDDGNTWGWWVGIDNIKLTANGEINDLCSTAKSLDIGSACIQSSNENAIFSGPIATNGDRLTASLWYELTAPSDGIIHITNEATYNDQLTVFVGTCENLTEAQFMNHDEQGFHGEEMYLQVGQAQKYFVRVSGIINEYGLSKGNNCLSATYVESVPLAQLEDIQTEAKVLSVTQQTCVSANNIHATIVESNIPASNVLARADVWYQFSPPTDNDYELVVTSEFAEMIILYDTNLNPIYTSAYGGNTIWKNLEANQLYFAQVSGVFSEIEGEICLQVRTLQTVPSSNDNCDIAATLLLDEAFDFYNGFQGFSGLYPSCEIYADHDIWLSYTTDEASSFYINVDCSFENTVTIYEGPCAELEEIWCGKGLTECDGSSLVSGLEPNTTYFIQVASTSHNNQLNTGYGSIEISESLSEILPLSLTVITDCASTMEARLQILVGGSENYELVGHTEQDVFQDGDEYHVIVIDENGCEKSESGIINCQANACMIEIETELVFPSCNEDAGGSINLEGTKGLGPYSYAWAHTEDEAAFQENLLAGTYFATVTDLNGCFKIAEIIIEEPEKLSVFTSSEDETTANAKDGIASATVMGGIFPYTYTWSHGPTGGEVDNLEPGTYTLTVTDYKGCQNTQTVTINGAGCNFNVISSIDSIDCYDGNTGMISVSGNLEITTYAWSNGGTANSIDGLSAGEYTVTITADNGCVHIEQFFLEDPAQIIVDSQVQDVLCYGDTNGAAEFTAEGGQGPFIYQWEDGYVGAERNGLTKGIYNITTTDSKNCEVTSTLTISQPDSLSTVSKEKTDVSCYNSEDGSVCIFIAGGTEPYNFTWNTGVENMSKLEDLPAGSYTLTVTDNNGCIYEESVEVIAPDPINSAIIAMGITSEVDGFIELEIDGGTEPYDIIWYQNTDSVGIGSTINGLGEGIYFAVVIDANGCVFTTENIMLSVVGIVSFDSGQFNLYPNPTTSKSVLSWDNIDISNYNVKVISTDGKTIDIPQVIQTDLTSIEFNFLHFPTGAYFIQLQAIDDTRRTLNLPIIIMNE